MTTAISRADADHAGHADRLLAQMTLVEKLRQLDDWFPNGNLRLGIPHMRSGEVLHGVCHPQCTSFPQALAMGATWDPELIERVAAVIALEARAVDIHLAFTPMLGLGRDGRWGRIEESYGEDPCLVSAMGCAFIRGLQGTGAERFDYRHIIATAKHFVADGEPCRGINSAPVEISETALRELHMRPFEDAVKRAGVGAIMPAHHCINRVPCHANPWLLDDVLRKEWGFDGIVVSDCIDIPKLYALGEPTYSEHTEQHRIACDWTEAGVLALRAGIDTELGGEWNTRPYGKRLADAVAAGTYPDLEPLIHRAARRILIAKMRLGLFDGRPVPPEDDPDGKQGSAGIRDGHEEYGQKIAAGETMSEHDGARRVSPDVLTNPAHDALALECARKAIVLLKNDGGLLPLDAGRLKTLAVIGPNAIDVALGGYSTGEPKHYVSVADGLRAFCGGEVEVLAARGCHITKPDGKKGWWEELEHDRSGIPEAVQAARRADLVVLVLGSNRGICGECADADDLLFTPAQEDLMRAVHAVGKPIVLVILSGRPHDLSWEVEHIPAIVEGFYLGQETGRALAEMLFGRTCPGGKLPCAMPRNVGQIPVLYNELWWAGPKAYRGTGRMPEPLFPFGFGLSYTTFAFSELAVTPNTMPRDGRAVASVKVTNTGDRTGDEVAQMYVTDDFASIVRPMRELKGFQRVTLAPGESARVEFPITFEELKFWKDGKWMVEPGTFQIWMGSCCTCQQRVELTVTG